MKRLVCIGILILFLFILIAIPVFAVIGNPTTITFGTNATVIRAKCYYNVNETGDMLFMAETYVHYASTPTDYTANQAFSYNILSADGTQVLLSKSIPNYENKVVGIYQTAAQVTAKGLTVGSLYNQRITGNPIIFASLVEGTNMVTAQMGEDSWIDQSIGKGTETDNLIAYVIAIAEDLEAHDGVGTYLEIVQGSQVLTSAGADIFLQGVPNLNTYIPSAFKVSSSSNSPSEPPSTGAINDYGGIGSNGTAGKDTSISRSLGPTISSGMTNLGLWLGGTGMPQWEAGMIGLFIIMGALAVSFYKVTNHPVVPIVLIVMTLPIAGFLGLIPIAMAFAITMLLVILTVWFFFSRGYV